MKFDPPLQKGTLVRRYKRFLADIITADGQEITIHCPNTGSMKNCADPGSSVWFSTSDNKKRKYPHTWELVAVDEGNALAGINTGRANSLVVEAINNGAIPKLQGYDSLRTEVKYGNEKSRIDILLESGERQCFIEVKNVTLTEGGQGYFPDAVTERGQKHLRELMAMVDQGARAVLVFCVQHTGMTSVAPAAHIDPKYAEIFSEAVEQGVEVLAYQAKLNAEQAELVHELPVVNATRRA